MHRSARRRLSALLVTGAIAVASAAISPAAAYAEPPVTTRRATSWFDGQACIQGRCAPVGQAFLWYDSWDPAGKDFRRAQLNWATPHRPCSTWVDFDAWSTDGQRKFWHAQGVTHSGCRFRDSVATTTLPVGSVVIPENAATICGTVYRAGNPEPKLVTRVCVYAR